MRSTLAEQHSRRIVPKTVVEQVHDAVLQAIFDHRFRPGDRIVETVLARELGVSQATVNQALFDLDSKGIVTKTPNKETRINRLRLSEIETLFVIRRTLEGLAAEAVARTATPETETSLRFWVDEMRAARDSHTYRFYLADYGFHQELHRQSRSPVIIRACQAIAVTPFAYLLSGSTSDLLPINFEVTVADHEEIVEAIMQSPTRAVEVVHAKVEKWLGNVMTHLRGRESS